MGRNWAVSSQRGSSAMVACRGTGKPKRGLKATITRESLLLGSTFVSVASWECPPKRPVLFPSGTQCVGPCRYRALEYWYGGLLLSFMDVGWSKQLQILNSHVSRVAWNHEIHFYEELWKLERHFVIFGWYVSSYILLLPLGLKFEPTTLPRRMRL